MKSSLDKEDHFKVTKLIEAGTKAESLILNDLVDDEEVVKICSYYHKCFVAAASYLQMNLPFNEKIF